MDCSQITDFLYIGRTPSLQDQDTLVELGVALIINMRFEKRPHRDSLIPTLWLPTIDSPLIRIPVRALRRGVESALKTIRNGRSIYVHCHGGVHRAVAMACCILIATGLSPSAAMNLVKEKRPKADPNVWYIHRQILGYAKHYSSP